MGIKASVPIITYEDALVRLGTQESNRLKTAFTKLSTRSSSSSTAVASSSSSSSSSSATTYPPSTSSSSTTSTPPPNNGSSSTNRVSFTTFLTYVLAGIPRIPRALAERLFLALALHSTPDARTLNFHQVELTLADWVCGMTILLQGTAMERASLLGLIYDIDGNNKITHNILVKFINTIVYDFPVPIDSELINNDVRTIIEEAWEEGKRINATITTNEGSSSSGNGNDTSIRSSSSSSSSVPRQSLELTRKRPTVNLSTLSLSELSNCSITIDEWKVWAVQQTKIMSNDDPTNTRWSKHPLLGWLMHVTTALHCSTYDRTVYQAYTKGLTIHNYYEEQANKKRLLNASSHTHTGVSNPVVSASSGTVSSSVLPTRTVPTLSSLEKQGLETSLNLVRKSSTSGLLDLNVLLQVFNMNLLPRPLVELMFRACDTQNHGRIMVPEMVHFTTTVLYGSSLQRSTLCFHMFDKLHKQYLSNEDILYFIEIVTIYGKLVNHMGPIAIDNGSSSGHELTSSSVFIDTATGNINSSALSLFISSIRRAPTQPLKSSSFSSENTNTTVSSSSSFSTTTKFPTLRELSTLAYQEMLTLSATVPSSSINDKTLTTLPNLSSSNGSGNSPSNNTVSLSTFITWCDRHPEVFNFLQIFRDILRIELNVRPPLHLAEGKLSSNRITHPRSVDNHGNDNTVLIDDNDDVDTNDDDDDLVPPDTEAQVILRVWRSYHKEEARTGDTWYVLPSNWWRSWCTVSSFDQLLIQHKGKNRSRNNGDLNRTLSNHSTNNGSPTVPPTDEYLDDDLFSVDEPSLRSNNNGLIVNTSSSSSLPVSAKVGPIETRTLLIDHTMRLPATSSSIASSASSVPQQQQPSSPVYVPPILIPNLRRGYDNDYVLVPSRVWIALSNWYGTSGPSIPRKVIDYSFVLSSSPSSSSSSMLLTTKGRTVPRIDIELYPLELTFVRLTIPPNSNSSNNNNGNSLNSPNTLDSNGTTMTNSKGSTKNKNTSLPNLPPPSLLTLYNTLDISSSSSSASFSSSPVTAETNTNSTVFLFSRTSTIETIQRTIQDLTNIKPERYRLWYATTTVGSHSSNNNVWPYELMNPPSSSSSTAATGTLPSANYLHRYLVHSSSSSTSNPPSAPPYGTTLQILIDIQNREGVWLTDLLGYSNLRILRDNSNDKLVNNPHDPSSSKGLAVKSLPSSSTHGTIKPSTFPSTTSTTSTNLLPRPYSLRPRSLVGFANMGNTCYLSSALQCLLALPFFPHYFLSGAWEADLNTTARLGSGGKLAAAFAYTLDEVWNLNDNDATGAFFRKVLLSPSSSNTLPTATYSPRKLKAWLAQIAPRFEGSDQHDAQDALATLLAMLSEDLNRIPGPNKPYKAAPDSEGRPDADVAEEWYVHQMMGRDRSFITALFAGQFKSTLTCENCGYSNVVFEPFTTLPVSLPEPNTRAYTFTIMFAGHLLRPLIVTVRLPLTATIGELRQAIAKAGQEYQQYLGYIDKASITMLTSNESTTPSTVKNVSSSSSSSSSYIIDPLGTMTIKDVTRRVIQVRRNKLKDNTYQSTTETLDTVRIPPPKCELIHNTLSYLPLQSSNLILCRGNNQVLELLQVDDAHTIVSVNSLRDDNGYAFVAVQVPSSEIYEDAYIRAMSVARMQSPPTSTLGIDTELSPGAPVYAAPYKQGTNTNSANTRHKLTMYPAIIMNRQWVGTGPIGMTTTTKTDASKDGEEMDTPRQDNVDSDDSTNGERTERINRIRKNPLTENEKSTDTKDSVVERTPSSSAAANDPLTSSGYWLWSVKYLDDGSIETNIDSSRIKTRIPLPAHIHVVHRTFARAGSGTTPFGNLNDPLLQYNNQFQSTNTSVTRSSSTANELIIPSSSSPSSSAIVTVPTVPPIGSGSFGLPYLGNPTAPFATGPTLDDKLYFSSPLVTLTFGLPSLFRISPWAVSCLELYVLVWEHCKRFIRTRPPYELLATSTSKERLASVVASASSSSASTTGTTGNATHRYASLQFPTVPSVLLERSKQAGNNPATIMSIWGFVIRRTGPGGIYCPRCPWTEGCTGCVLGPNPTLTLLDGLMQISPPARKDVEIPTIGIEWDPVIIDNSFDRSEAYAHEWHSNVTEASIEASKPVSLSRCLDDFSRPEKLEEAGFCSKCSRIKHYVPKVTRTKRKVKLSPTEYQQYMLQKSQQSGTRGSTHGSVAYSNDTKNTAGTSAAALRIPVEPLPLSRTLASPEVATATMASFLAHPSPVHDESTTAPEKNTESTTKPSSSSSTDTTTAAPGTPYIETEIDEEQVTMVEEEAIELRGRIKRLELYRLPPVLIIQLKRFRHTTYVRGKLSTPVLFPVKEALCMRSHLAKAPLPKLPTDLRIWEYLGGKLAAVTTSIEAENHGKDRTHSRRSSTNGTSDNASSSNAAVSGKTNTTNTYYRRSSGGPTELSVDGVPLLLSRSLCDYTLCSVISHTGVMGGGHYIAYSKSPLTGTWYCFNDKHIIPITNTNDIVTPEAYILFYVRSDMITGWKGALMQENIRYLRSPYERLPTVPFFPHSPGLSTWLPSEVQRTLTKESDHRNANERNEEERVSGSVTGTNIPKESSSRTLSFVSSSSSSSLNTLPFIPLTVNDLFPLPSNAVSCPDLSQVMNNMLNLNDSTLRSFITSTLNSNSGGNSGSGGGGITGTLSSLLSSVSFSLTGNGRNTSTGSTNSGNKYEDTEDIGNTSSRSSRSNVPMNSGSGSGTKDDNKDCRIM